eukprot:ANDGO_07570.mRNA.1 hypothetical protein
MNVSFGRAFSFLEGVVASSLSGGACAWAIYKAQSEEFRRQESYETALRIYKKFESPEYLTSAKTIDNFLPQDMQGRSLTTEKEFLDVAQKFRDFKAQRDKTKEFDELDRARRYIAAIFHFAGVTKPSEWLQDKDRMLAFGKDCRRLGIYKIAVVMTIANQPSNKNGWDNLQEMQEGARELGKKCQNCAGFADILSQVYSLNSENNKKTSK